MENQLFTWKSCKSDGFGATTYQNVCLTVPIGGYKVGTHFDSAVVDYEEEALDLLKDGARFVFKLVIYAI